MGGRYVQQIRRAPAVSFWLLLKCSIFCFLFSLLFASQTANAASRHPHGLKLQTSGAHVEMMTSVAVDTFYTLLFDPNVVFLLFIIAMFGIYLEISHPGVIVPGVVGAIALILFLFAISSLSPNWTGLALLVLSFILLILDVQLPAHGILTAGAVVSLITGAFLLFDSDGPNGGRQIDPIVIYVTAGMIGLVGFALVTYLVRVRRLPVTTGIEGMIGAKVIALTPLCPDGRVRYGGENWAALLEPPATLADKGSELEIMAVEGLCLHVQPVRSQNLIELYSESAPEAQ